MSFPAQIRSISSVLLLLISTFANAQVPIDHYKDLKYRLIGPFRASRTVGGTGVPTQPNVFYVGVNNGGVWKTDDYGRTWQPIFDDAPTGSVGDIAVSPSHPNVIYVGTGEGLHRPDLGVGDGIFKSADGGKTWEHIGLDDVQQVGRLIVHPTDPNIVFVAGLGHPYGPNEERGVFRTKDGGNSWEKVLYVNDRTGAIQVEMDPTDPNVLFADMWEHQEGPWENGSFLGTESGLYKSSDGGDSWRKITNGLPKGEEGLGRIGVCIAPSDPSRMYATVDAGSNSGIYRSDDAGESWYRISTDSRTYGRGGDFAELKVHPETKNIVFSGNVAAYRSDDGGKTWWSNKGAPGGDDYHRIWINPLQPDIMLYVADQGAVVTVNGGKTWSSWYNQPTSQLYHVSTDNDFPYMVYGGQQESGAIGIASRGNGGQISFREFMGVGADEYAYVAPDPKDPDIIYGGRVTRFNKRTGQSQFVGPEALRSGNYRNLRTMPLLFHPADDNMLLYATNVLWKTLNGGRSWEIISPDLSREDPEVPKSVGVYKSQEIENMRRRGVIYAVGPSPIEVNIIWAGTDDGSVHVTTDGGTTWNNVTPPSMSSWDKVSQIDAGHFDKNTAYIAINAIRKDDMTPYVYRTHDLGKTWELVNNGLNPMGPVNVVREDPKQKGLLFAGTEREVYFSADDGDHWQSLRLNMPASSIRDLVIHEDDLVIGTHGRSIFILDNFSPLREMVGLDDRSAYLFKPASAVRVRWNMFSDTPLPPEEPTAPNPPDGASLDYMLSDKAEDVILEIVDMEGKLVRRYSSDDIDEDIDTTSFRHPTYWLRPPQKLGLEPGHHRYTWDLRYAPPRGTSRTLSIAATYMDTPTSPQGPFVHPGKYLVRLIVDGISEEKEIEVILDPRVDINKEDIALQSELSLHCYDQYHLLQGIVEKIDTMKKQNDKVRSLRGNGRPGDMDYMYGSIYRTEPDKETLVGLQRKYIYMINVLQSADVRPTDQVISGIEELSSITDQVVGRWEKLNKGR